MEEILGMFEQMCATLQNKKSYQKERRLIYEGKYTASTLNFALPKKLERKLVTHLGWPKTAVDTLHHDLRFDGFKNDSLGFTRLLSESGGYEAIDAAVKNSMIGACSFISVLPGEDGKPFFTVFSGAEATGLYDSRKGMIAGLTINSYSSTFGQKFIKDYLLFTPGTIYKIAAESREVIEAYDVPTQKMLLIPFIYDQDVAVKPFGSSRINDPAINALESALRTLKLIEFGHDLRVAIRNILLADGVDPDDLAKSEQNPSMTSLLTIFNSSSTGTLKLEQLVAPDTKELQDQLGLLAANFGNSVSMSASSFGYQPANGSFGAKAIEEQAKAYNDLVKHQKRSYGASIKALAIAAMSLATGQSFEEWEEIVPVFEETISNSEFGAIADGLQKLAILAPGIDFTEFIERKVLGKTVREEALKIDLPDLSLALKNAEKFSSIKEISTETL